MNEFAWMRMPDAKAAKDSGSPEHVRQLIDMVRRGAQAGSKQATVEKIAAQIGVSARALWSYAAPQKRIPKTTRGGKLRETYYRRAPYPVIYALESLAYNPRSAERLFAENGPSDQ